MPRKKGNGEGTIYHNGKYWVGQVTIEIDYDTGKLKRKSVYGKTKKEVQEKVTTLLNQVNTNTYVEPSKMTVKEWAGHWYQTFKKNRLSESTKVKYGFNLKNHVYIPFGNIPLRSITTLKIQSYINNLCETGISTETIRMLVIMYKEMLEQAVKLEFLSKKPCNNIVLPKAKQKRPARALSREEQQKLVDYCLSSNSDMIFVFLLGTGMQIWETLGLSWSSIDWQSGMIKIERIAVEIRGKAKLQESIKTESGYRMVPLTPKTKKLLETVENMVENK